MRTTVNLDDDVVAAIERTRRERAVGVSQAVNDLIRAGLRGQEDGARRFRPRARNLRLKVDVTNVAEAIELLEGPPAR